jgi:hypothetical protein
MQQVKVFLLIGCLGALITVMAPPKAKADWVSQKTTVTFNGPVELPGITLPAGTYVFRLLDPINHRDYVQVLSADEQTVYATIRAIPDYRVHRKDKTVMSFEERAAGAPVAIKEWFFPDNHWGHEFVYSKPNIVELAKANQQPVMPATPPAPEMAKNLTAPPEAPAAVVQPSVQEPQIAEAMSPQAQAPAPEKMPMSLPKTASPIFLIGLMGMFLTTGGLTLRFVSKRI